MGAAVTNSEMQDMCASIFDTYTCCSDGNIFFSMDFEDDESEQVDVEQIEHVKERYFAFIIFLLVINCKFAKAVM